MSKYVKLILVVIFLWVVFIGVISYIGSKRNKVFNVSPAQNMKIANQKWPKSPEMLAYEKINILCASKKFDEALKEFDKIKTKTLVLGPHSVVGFGVEEMYQFTSRSLPFISESGKSIRNIYDYSLELAKSGKKDKAIKIINFGFDYSNKLMLLRPYMTNSYLMGELCYFRCWQRLVDILEELGDIENKNEAENISSKMKMVVTSLKKQIKNDLLARKPSGFFNQKSMYNDEEKNVAKYIEIWNSKITEFKCKEFLNKL